MVLFTLLYHTQREKGLVEGGGGCEMSSHTLLKILNISRFKLSAKLSAREASSENVQDTKHVS